MIEAGLRAAGRRTGLFTSPHLIEPTERIQVDGIPVTPEQFRHAFEVVHAAAEKCDLDCHPTYFETVTAMGFWLFRELGVETAVIEVGLGGRLDATNVVEPVLTVITPIDFDHEAYLGHTLEAIAGEKAGILKPGVPAVFAPQRPEAAAVLEKRATELGVPVIHARDFKIRNLEIDARGSRFSGLECPLPGEHQVQNAVTAALALEVLGIDPRGISETHWPGRLEYVAPNPDVLLDGAHNPAGARALAAYLKRFCAGRRIWMIYGAMRDKAVEEVAGILFPLADELIFPALDSSRAVRPEVLIEMAGRGQAAANVGAVLESLETLPGPPAPNHSEPLRSGGVRAEDLIVITGSLFLVGEARDRFLRTQRPPYA